MLRVISVRWWVGLARAFMDPPATGVTTAFLRVYLAVIVITLNAFGDLGEPTKKAAPRGAASRQGGV
jgi:hypothetical protein